MKALIRTIATMMLIIVVAGCGSSSFAPPVAFLYVLEQGSNTIQAFNQSSTGQLTALSVASFGSSPIPIAMALHPSKNFVYVANSTSNAVSGYALDTTTGIFTPVGTGIAPSPVGTNPVAVGVNSGGQFLYVLNQGSSNISVFRIDPNRGLLTEISGSPFPLSASGQFMVMSPTAGFFYVSLGAMGIASFSIGSDGTPSQLAVTSFAAPSSIAGMAIDPKGQLLYAADSGSNAVRGFSIQSSGVLTTIAGSPFNAGTQPVAIAVDATSSLVYSANEGSGDVSGFRVTNTGALGPAPGSPFATAGTGVLTPSQPVFVTVDATNGFLYVANLGSKSVAAFSIKISDGSLTAVTNSPFTQTAGPVWLLSVK